jgi:phosphoribosylformylglycinamidine (FGAM) synthase PurS component
MNKMVSKFALAAGIVLAMTFTLGCTGKKTVADIKGDEEVISIRNELQELCNKDFIETSFCGIGQGSSNSESMSSQVASVQARENLAASVQTAIEARAKTFGMNDPDGNALEGAAMRAIANVGGEISDIRTQKVRTMYNKEEKKYTVYTLVTSPRDAALELAKQKLRASQELAQIQRTLNLNANVERILDEQPTQVKN